MREIKFRAWFKDKGSMVYFGSLGFTCDLECAHPTLIADNNEHWYGEDSAQPEIMQFTGLKDRKGVDIYEGDIVRYSTKYYGNLRTDRMQEVRWIDDMQHDGFGEPLATGYLLYGFDWEVVGNVHQNPELLKSL